MGEKPTPSAATRDQDEPILRAQDVTVWLGGSNRVIRAVDEVSFDLRRGEVLGIVGESGAGKSVLARTVMGLTGLDPRARVEGSITIAGTPVVGASERQMRRLWSRRVAIVFQDPLRSLNPVVRIERQITETIGARSGATRSQAATRAKELLEEVGIVDPPRVLRAYPSQLSGGMRQRVAIAIALAGEPDIIVADEPTTALDVTTANRIMALFQRLQRAHGSSLIVISHDFRVVTGIADTVAVMYAGRFAEYGPAASVTSDPRMPYTRALLDCIPTLGGNRGTVLPAIPGRPPDPAALSTGCAFAPRCDRSSPKCSQQPAPTSPGEAPQRSFECWHPLEPAPTHDEGSHHGR
jgi:peptide/nickel transport system ATP-binding protein